METVQVVLEIQARLSNFLIFISLSIHHNFVREVGTRSKKAFIRIDNVQCHPFTRILQREDIKPSFCSKIVIHPFNQIKENRLELKADNLNSGKLD